MDIGKIVKKRRNHLGLSQDELANRANISKSFLSLIESGKREPSLTALSAIAGALEVPLNILIFLGSDDDELQRMPPEVIRNLRDLALKLLETESENAIL